MLVRLCVVVLVAAAVVAAKYDSPDEIVGSSLAASPPVTKRFDVRDYGAVGDATTLNTEAFAKAIKAATSAGGGLVVVTDGHYLTGPIRLLDNTYLFVDATGVVLASPNRSDYPSPFPANPPNSAAVVTSFQATNVGLLGGGVVDGNSQPRFVASYNRSMDQLRPVMWTGPPENCTGECRPRLVQFANSSNVLIRDVTIQNSADWSMHVWGCTEVLVDNVTVHSDFRWPNGDGMDLDASVNVTVQNSYIETGDDALCPKASPLYPQGIQNMLIRNCVVRSRSSGFKLGSTTYSNVNGLLLEDTYIWASNRGLAIQHRDTGNLSNIFFRNIVVDGTFRQPTNWWGAGEAIWITSVQREPTTVLGSIGNIMFQNITVRRAEAPALVERQAGKAPLTNITFKDVSYVVQADWRPTPSKQGMVLTGHVHDFRPSDVVKEELACGSEAVCDGLRLNNVDGAEIDGLGMTFVGEASDPANQWWGPSCVGHDTASSNIAVKSVTCARGTNSTMKVW